MPFLENVTRGRNVPRERLEAVAHHYERFGGVSPINGQNRELIAALETELREHGIDLPIYFGNRNWHPFLADTLREMRDVGRAPRARVLHLGVQLVLRLPPVPRGHRPRAGRGRPRRARGAEAARVLQPPRLRRGERRPRPRRARADPEERRAAAPIVFTAHSIPTAMAERCRYADQLAETVAPRRRGRRRRRTGRSSTRAAAARPTSRGSSPTCCDHLRELRGERRAPTSSSPRSASSPTTSRCSTTSTSRPSSSATELGRQRRPRRHGRHAPGLRRDDPRADRGAPRRRREACRRTFRPDGRRVRDQLLPTRHGRPEPLGRHGRLSDGRQLFAGFSVPMSRSTIRTASTPRRSYDTAGQRPREATEAVGRFLAVVGDRAGSRERMGAQVAQIDLLDRAQQRTPLARRQSTRDVAVAGDPRVVDSRRPPAFAPANTEPAVANHGHDRRRGGHGARRRRAGQKQHADQCDDEPEAGHPDRVHVRHTPPLPRTITDFARRVRSASSTSVRVGGHGEVSLPDVLADSGSRRAAEMPEADPPVTEVVR